MSLLLTGLERVRQQRFITVFVWLHSGSGSTCLISSIVILVVVMFFAFGGVLYVELCRGLLYDHDKGNIFKVTLVYRHIKTIKFLAQLAQLFIS